MDNLWIFNAITYWQQRVDEGDLGCDWREADRRCWRCGHKRKSQKCHIVPQSLGGSDDVSNIIPLCAQCHDEMPNVTDATCVWHWIAADHGATYDTYWSKKAIKESGLSVQQLMLIDLGKLNALIQDEVGIHFGQLSGRARVSVSSVVWALRTACQHTSH